MLTRLMMLIGASIVVNAQVTPLQINLDKTVPVAGLPAGAILNAPKCGEHGDVYLRYFGRVNNATSPLIKVAADGSAIVPFRFDAAGEDVKDLRVYDFTIAGNSVYVVGVDPKDVTWILRYETNGNFEEAIKLNRSIFPVRIAVFPAGEFLILGTRADASPASGKPAGEHDIGALELFSPSGQFLTDVSLKTDMLSLSKKKGESEGDRRKGIDLSLLEAGGGNVYLIPYQPKPSVSVISVAGKVSKEFSLATPEGYLPLSAHAMSTQLLLELVQHGSSGNDQFLFGIYDGQTGAMIYEYQLAKELGVFACYDWNGNFTFLGTSAGRRVLQYGRVQ